MQYNMDARVSVIIPTLNAETNIILLLKMLRSQSVTPLEIIVVDSESTDRTVLLAKEFGATILMIKRNAFNHGGTRDYALKQSKGEYVLFLTHDAIPRNTDLIYNLLKALNRSPSIAAVYGRQVSRDDATYAEHLIRNYNYPAESHEFSASDIASHGIKTFFMSNVCALYRRDVYEKLGGFESDILTNEDMLYSARAINSGYVICYESKAEVIHSHNFSLKEQYQRNFLQGYEIERHKELLAAATQNMEGLRFVQNISKGLLSQHKIFAWIRFAMDCLARYAGNFMGKRKARKEALTACSREYL